GLVRNVHHQAAQCALSKNRETWSGCNARKPVAMRHVQRIVPIRKETGFWRCLGEAHQAVALRRSCKRVSGGVSVKLISTRGRPVSFLEPQVLPREHSVELFRE